MPAANYLSVTADAIHSGSQIVVGRMHRLAQRCFLWSEKDLTEGFRDSNPNAS